MTREERTHVPIVSYTKDREIEETITEFVCEGLIVVKRCLAEIGEVRRHPESAWGFGAERLKQQSIGHSVVRIRIVRRYGTLVTPEQRDARPVHARGAQGAEENQRGGSTG